MHSISIRLQSLYRNRVLQILLKTALFAALSLLLYTQLQEGIARISENNGLLLGNAFSSGALLLISLAALLMPVNWMLETLKWQSLMKSEEKLPFDRAMKAVLAGLTVSLFTPNRVGEYGGRILFVAPKMRMDAVISTLMGSAAQWLLLMGAGIIGLSYLLYQKLIPQQYFQYSISLLITAFVVFFILIFFYFRMNCFVEKAIKWKLKPLWAKKIQNLLEQRGKSSGLGSALFFAFARYLVYALQYLIVLCAVGFDSSLLNGFAALCFVFMLQTGLPVPPSMGLLARGSIAVMVFGIVFGNSPEIRFYILASTLIIWVINLMIPALIGAAFIASRNRLTGME